MADMSKIAKFASDLIGEATTGIRKMIPEQFSPEKKFVNATAAALALMIVADGKVEAEEVEQGMKFIQHLDPVVELGLQTEAVELLQKYIERINEVEGDDVKFLFERGKILGDIALVNSNETYVSQIKNMLDLVTSGGGTADGEIKMKHVILENLS